MGKSRTIEEVYNRSYCKLGTIPKCIFTKQNPPFREGQLIEYLPGHVGLDYPSEFLKWKDAKIDKVNGDGYFFASKI